MDKQLRRILNLVRKTGDRMVVTDANGDDVYVVMGLEQYENLVIPNENVELSRGLPSEAFQSEGWWNECEPEEEEGRVGPPNVAAVSVPLSTTTAPPPSDIWEAMPPAGSDSETWDISRMTESEKVDLEKQFQNYQQEKGREVSGQEKTVEQPVEAKIEPKDEDFGEEQFYLEPIE